MPVEVYKYVFYSDGTIVDAKWLSPSRADDYCAELADEIGASVECWEVDPVDGDETLHCAFDPD